MNFLIWIVLGAVSGWIASLIMGTNAKQGLVLDIVVGIVGALLGGFIMQLLGYGGTDGLNVYSIVVAVLGAMILTWIIEQFRGTQVV